MFVAGQPMHDKGHEIYLFESMPRGERLKLIANVFIVGGLGAGAVGCALLVAGLVRPEPNRGADKGPKEPPPLP